MPNNELDQLKSLLFGEEQRRIEKVSQRLEEPQLRSQDVADVLPNALVKTSKENPEAIANALRVPITEGLREAMRKDIKGFADALFPVMGPAIRKAIVESMRSMIQGINQTVEQSFSLRGFKWRMEAARTGVPFSEVVMRHTMVYRVEQAFLIQGETGLLVSHASANEQEVADSDAVSAMLSAIQSFVRDSFTDDSREGLDTVDVGEHTVWLVHGPYAMLACVIRGVAPGVLRTELRQILEQIHHDFGADLKEFMGDPGSVAGVEEEVAQCLRLQLRADDSKHKRPLITPGSIIAVGLPIGLLVVWLVKGWLDEERLAQTRDLLDSQPGISVLESRVESGAWLLRLLKDPLAAPPEQFLPEAHWFYRPFRLQSRPYLSLEDPILQRRIKQRLNVPDSVHLRLEAGYLVADGLATPGWIAEFKSKAAWIYGVSGVDDRGLQKDYRPFLNKMRRELFLPTSLNTRVEGEWLVITGEAPQKTQEHVAAYLIMHEPNLTLRTERFIATERAQMQEIVDGLTEVDIYFASALLLSMVSIDDLSEVSQKLARFQRLARRYQENYRIILTGHSDQVGSQAANVKIRRDRVAYIKTWLVEKAGIPASAIFTQVYDHFPEPGSTPNPAERKVHLRLEWPVNAD